jgi:hypothetical protein
MLLEIYLGNTAAVKWEDSSLIKPQGLKAQQQCQSSDWARSWQSQPYAQRMPAGNLILSLAYMYTAFVFFPYLNFKYMLQ